MKNFMLLLLMVVSTLTYGQSKQVIDADTLCIQDGACIDKNELGYLDGSTSNIQTQIDGKQSTLNDSAGLAGALSDETGTGAAVFGTSPTLTTPNITAPTGLVKGDVGLGNVDNTSDANKPISTATQTALDLKANDADVVHKSGDESVAGTKTFTGKLVASSTANGSTPCPVMTQAQRDAIASPANGDCVFNSNTKTINIYDSTAPAWNEVSGGGGGNNLNILTNGGFEDGITSWTLTAGTGASEAVVVVEGGLSYKATLSSETLELKQSSTTNAAQFAGTVQGMASCRVKTALSGVSVCSINDGTTSTTNCATVTNDGNWQMLRVPFVLSSTSNGVAVVSSGAITGDVYVDDCFVGMAKDFDSVPVVTAWKPYTATLTNLGNATQNLEYAQVGESLFIRGKITIGSTLPTGQFNIGIPAGLTMKSLSFSGKATAVKSGQPFYTGAIGAQSLTSFGVYSEQVANLWIANQPFTWAAGDYFEVEIGPVPIVGWSSTVNTYSDGGPKQIELFAYRNTNQSISSGGSITAVQVNAVSRDTASGFNTGTYTYTIPEDGYYSIAGFIKYASNATGFRDLFLRVNGSEENIFDVRPAVSGEETPLLISNPSRYFAKGTTLGLSTYQTSGVALNITYASLQVSKNFTPSVITASFKDQAKCIGGGACDIQAVQFGSGPECAASCSTGSCNICMRFGTKITSVDWQATGTYRAMGIDSTKYLCFGSAYDNGSAFSSLWHNTQASTSSYATVQSVGSVGGDLNRTVVYCIGKE